MRVVLLTCGVSPNGNCYAPQVLRAAAEKFNGARVYSSFKPGPMDETSHPIERIIGSISNARFDEETLSVVADFAAYGDVAKVVVEEGARLWHDAEGKGEAYKEDGQTRIRVDEIIRVHALALTRKRS